MAALEGTTRSLRPTALEPVRACCHAWRADVRKPTRPRLRRDGVTIDGVSALGFVVLLTSRSRDLEAQPKRLVHLS